MDAFDITIYAISAFSIGCLMLFLSGQLQGLLNL